MNKYIIQTRKYYPEFTESELIVPELSARKIWVLEDKKQPYGVKVLGETCIPEGIYDVSITMSTRFGKDMMLLSNRPDGSIVKDCVSFSGVRPHGGNVVTNTEGCPLLNYNTDGKGKQWERASDAVFEHVQKWLKLGISVKWIITS
jgi:hypothetical protein